MRAGFVLEDPGGIQSPVRYRETNRDGKTEDDRDYATDDRGPSPKPLQRTFPFNSPVISSAMAMSSETLGSIMDQFLDWVEPRRTCL